MNEILKIFLRSLAVGAVYGFCIVVLIGYHNKDLFTITYAGFLAIVVSLMLILFKE